MSFDRTNPVDLLALQTEINTDPLGMGYPGVIQSTVQLLSLLNDPSNNVGGETTGADFTINLILKVLEPNELTIGGQFTQGELDYIRLMFKAIQNRFEDMSEFKQKFIDLFPANAQTLTNLNAQLRTLSRAEVLFGEGTVLVREDWFAARDYVA